MDEVRAALGYERLNLFGGSYGTRAALTYLKRHPQRVRTAILQGVSPTNHFMPSDFPQQTERALQGVLAECLADKACNKAFPNIKEETKAVLAQLIKGPVEVEIQKPNSSDRVKVKLSRDLAAEAIRYMLYSPVPASRVPLALHLASQGNYVPLAQTAIRYRLNLVASGSNGMYLSVTCAEDLPWIKAGEGERMAANTFLGDYRLRQQREACALWPRAEIERDYAQPVKSDVPVLILTGEWDPVTPPSNGERAAKTLTNSLHVVVPQRRPRARRTRRDRLHRQTDRGVYRTRNNQRPRHCLREEHPSKRICAEVLMRCQSCQTALPDDAQFCASCGLPTARHSSDAATQIDLPQETNADSPDRQTHASVDPRAGLILDSKYKLIESLGQGGMGSVFRAQRLHIGDEVAVKLLHHDLVREKQALERFRREARAAAMIRHPNVVSIHDFSDGAGAGDGSIYRDGVGPGCVARRSASP